MVVECRKNGEEGLNYIKDCMKMGKPLPGLILLDLNMPVLDGFDFLRTVKKMNIPVLKQIHVIVLTSSDSSSDKNKVKKLGASSYLTKPLCKTKLESTLENNVAA